MKKINVNYQIYEIPEDELRKLILEHYKLPSNAEVVYPSWNTYLGTTMTSMKITVR